MYDKGIWKTHEGLVELKSDREVTWDPRIDRKFVAFHRHSRSKEILIIGLEHDLPYFDAHENGLYFGEEKQRNAFEHHRQQSGDFSEASRFFAAPASHLSHLPTIWSTNGA